MSRFLSRFLSIEDRISSLGLRTVWSTVTSTRCCGPQNEKGPISRNKRFPRRLRKPKIHPFSFRTRIRSHSALFWFHIAHTGTDKDTGQDMSDFQNFSTKNQISWLSQCNLKLVAEAVQVHWNSYFLRESEIYSLQSNTHSAGSKFFRKVAPRVISILTLFYV